MKKRHLLVMAVLVVAMSLAIAVPAIACTQGCTPGYWKQPQHLDSWLATGYSPYQSFYSAFGVGPADITLLEALNKQGGGENAFLRHAVAALLNATHPDVDYLDPSWVMEKVLAAYAHPQLFVFEYVKDRFVTYNESFCPLN